MKHKYTARDYDMAIWWSDEDQLYLAKTREFPFVTTHGKTPEQAAHALTFVLNDVIQNILSKGESLPEPLQHLATA